MPQTILNQALYQDRTVQDWHRESFSASDWAIDLDLLGACNSCQEPIYLIEATTNPRKPVTILRRLAERANLPAIVILHDTERIISAQTVWPGSGALPEEKWVRSLLMIYRQQHLTAKHNRPFDCLKINEVVK